MKTRTKLPYATLQELQQALIGLDEGYNAVVDAGDGRKASARVPFVFGGIVRLDIARNLGVLRRALQDYTAARDALIREISGGRNRIDAKQSPEQAQRFMDEHKKLADTEVPVDLKPFTAEALNLEDNPVPARVLDLLLRSGLLTV